MNQTTNDHEYGTGIEPLPQRPAQDEAQSAEG